MTKHLPPILKENARRYGMLLFLFISFFLTTGAFAQDAYTDAGLPVPTVKSDKDDYVPGEVAIITGTGWTKDQQVDVHFEETPAFHAEHQHDFHGIAVDADGNWKIEYQIEDRHLGVAFDVHVIGKQTGFEAYTFFTDGIVTPAPNGVDLSADFAFNSTSSLKKFSQIGDIIITESDKAEFTGTNQTLILTAPAGWKFKSGTGSVSRSSPSDLFGQPSITVNSSTITITYSVSKTGQIDILTITNIEVQADNGAAIPSLGYIYRSTSNPGTASMTGIITTSNTTGSGGSSFGRLSQKAGALKTLVMSSVPSPQTAGTPFSVTLTAKDQFNNTSIDFTGTVNMSTSAVSISPATSNSFAAGTVTQDFSVAQSGIDKTITATSPSPSATVTSNTFTVNHGALDNFLVEASGGGLIGTQTAGTPFNIRIVARDLNNNTITSFNGGNNKAVISSTGTLSAGSGNTASFSNGVLDPHSVTFSNSGSFTITATQFQGTKTGTSNSFTVNASACTAPSITTQPSNQTKIYGENATFTVAASGTATLTYQWQEGITSAGTTTWTNVDGTVNTTALTASLTLTNPTVAMSGRKYRVIVTGACIPTATSDGNATLTVNKAEQVISWTAPTAITYGTALSETQLNASVATGDSRLTYTPAAGTVLNAGPQTLSVTAAATDNFNAKTATVSLTVNKASQTITFAEITEKTFGDAAFAIAPSASSTLPVAISTTGGIAYDATTGKISITGAGAASVTATQAGNDNYNAATAVIRSFNVKKADQTIDFAALGGKTFGDAPFTVSATATSGDAVSFAIVSGPASINTTTNTITITGAGDVTVRASQAGNTNYNAAPAVDRSFNVACPVATITAGGSLNICQGGSVTLTASAGTAYQWFKDAVAILGATERTYSANVKGSYTVVVTNSNCSITSSATTVTELIVASVRANDGLSAPTTTVAIGTSTTPATTTYTISNTNAASYTWSVTYSENISGISSEISVQGKSGGNIVNSNGNKTITVTWPTDAPRVYKVRAVYSNSCSYNSDIFVAVYDPTAGFVTGGGTINSPEGALLKSPTGVSDPSTIKGLANFGFVSRYKKGSTTIVEGNSEFIFTLGGLNFKSSMHESGTLVISGERATYKGKGVMRDAAGVQVNNLTYGFMLAAVDGQVNGGTTGKDRYRIKIWEVVSGEMVYDNLINADENTDLTAHASTVLHEGSIVIHTPTSGKKSESVSTQSDLFAPVVATESKLTGYPNPFRGNATIAFTLAQDEDYKMDIYDVRGSLVKSLPAGKAKANTPVEVQLDGNNTPVGVYILRLTTKSGVQNLRMIRE